MPDSIMTGSPPLPPKVQLMPDEMPVLFIQLFGVVGVILASQRNLKVRSHPRSLPDRLGTMIS